MAVAGLHNLSAFGPSFGESQSPASRQWSDEPGTPSPRASSLLQMWRELEGDHMASHSHRSRLQRNGLDSEALSISNSDGQVSKNGHTSEDVDETGNQVITGLETEHDDNNSIISEQSSDLGETERERVRQIFREWMSSGAVGHSPNGLHLNNRSGPQWLGENECERVRIIREWAQMNSQQRKSRVSVRDGGAEAGSQIQQVRDGLVVSHNEIGARRPIRRLCGRQTLLDLLQRVQCERKEELQGLLEQKPVSDFTHRNRIQAFLRGRFLRNERVTPDERPSTVSATELGMLRQRQTVSGLREGFISKLEKSASTSSNNAESDSWFGDQNSVESESPCRQSEMTCISSNGSLNQAGFIREVTEVEDMGLLNVVSEQEVSLSVDGRQEEVSLDVSSTHSSANRDLNDEATEQEVTAAEDAGNRHGGEINAASTNELPLETDDIIQSGAHEVFAELYESGNSLISVQETSAHITDLDRDTDEPALARVDEFHDSAIETQERSWERLTNVTLAEWSDGHRESIDRSWHESSNTQLFLETSDNNVDQSQMQEPHEDWPSHDLQEAIDSWLDMPSGDVGASVPTMDTSHFSDDDNVHAMELRELFSRRRVSSLLRSSFRESLDQVLQSHVERLGHASGDWEPDDTSSSSRLVGQDHRQQNGDTALDLSDVADRNPFAPTATFFTASQPLRDEEIQDASLLYNLGQHLGTEWEVVSELRIDLARVQQRLNNMQSMLEQCMDMQIELQRSVRQEVSAALNRPTLTRDASKGIALYDESQWEHISRGICCLCQDSNIDSLLYRCGHMCTCSNCAETLIQGTGKCPMCHAPVVEAVRAYFIQ